MQMERVTPFWKSVGVIPTIDSQREVTDSRLASKLATVFEIFSDEQDAINSYYPDRKLKTFDILDFVQKMKQEE